MRVRLARVSAISAGSGARGGGAHPFPPPTTHVTTHPPTHIPTPTHPCPHPQVDSGSAFPPDPAFELGYVAAFGHRGADARSMTVTRNEVGRRSGGGEVGVEVGLARWRRRRDCEGGEEGMRRRGGGE